MTYDPFLNEPWGDSAPGKAGCARLAVATVAAVVAGVAMTVWGVRPVLRVTVGPLVLLGLAGLAVWGVVWTRRHPDEYSAIDDRHAVDEVLRGGLR